MIESFIDKCERALVSRNIREVTSGTKAENSTIVPSEYDRQASSQYRTTSPDTQKNLNLKESLQIRNDRSHMKNPTSESFKIHDNDFKSRYEYSLPNQKLQPELDGYKISKSPSVTIEEIDKGFKKLTITNP